MYFNWYFMLAALAVSELVHNMFEVWGMRQKVEWLGQSLKGKPHGTWPIHIDSHLKVWSLHIGMLFSISGVTYALFSVANISNHAVVLLGVATLIANYFLTVVKVHHFHIEIGALIAQAKRSKPK